MYDDHEYEHDDNIEFRGEEGSASAAEAMEEKEGTSEDEEEFEDDYNFDDEGDGHVDEGDERAGTGAALRTSTTP